jgi:DNA-directed RNA polymerase subunit beta
MGTHMQCQAVPLITPSSPVIGTGMENLISKMMGRVIYAPFDGEILHADADKVTIKEKDKRRNNLFINL